MIRTKLGLLGLCAVVLGMMAVSASSAQASLFKWLILNAAHTASTELKAALAGELDGVELALEIHILGDLFWLTCTEFSLLGTNLEALGTLTTGSIVIFTNCEFYTDGPLSGPLGCKVKTAGQSAGTIRSNKVKGALLLHEGVLVMKMEPETGETLATVLTEGCVVPESNPIRGKLFLKDCLGEAEVHKVKHLFEKNDALTELWVGSKTEEHLLTDVLGSIWLFLANSASGNHAGLEWAGIHNAP